MSNFGLKTVRENGTNILIPEMFTVRPVETFLVDGNITKAPMVINRPKVKAGMFATCTPSRQYTPFDPGKTAHFDTYLDYKMQSVSGTFYVGGMVTFQLMEQAAMTPKITCSNGAVTLSAPIPNGWYNRFLYIHIFEYI